MVEGDLIVRDQEWATPKQDGRHYPVLVPVEVRSHHLASIGTSCLREKECVSEREMEKKKGGEISMHIYCIEREGERERGVPQTRVTP